MRYRIDARRITHERLGDEVIIIDVSRGAYYAGTGPAADLWTLVSQNASLEQATQELASLYACNPEVALRDIKSALDFLVAREVLQLWSDTQEHEAKAREAAALPDIARAAWAPPRFDEYLDMWDLIQLDPIHDVGDAGWPFVAPAPRV